MSISVSARAEIIARRNYHRPLNLNDPRSPFETWEQVIGRVIQHQAWLWNRAIGRGDVDPSNLFTRADLIAYLGSEARADELCELFKYMHARACLVAGRTLWLGGTPTSRRREASQFNCSYTELETPADKRDAFWLLLQGCGVGGHPLLGSLYSFPRHIPLLEVIPTNPDLRERIQHSALKVVDDGGVKTGVLVVGDSAEAWAYAAQLFLTFSKSVGKLVLDCSNIRPGGQRLKGYGWISHGHGPLATAFNEIFKIRNEAPGTALTFAQIHNIFNLLGTVLSTRRSAEIVLCDATDKHMEEFALFKSDMKDSGWWKYMSNNTVSFDTYDPPVDEINRLFDLMVASGGSEPGIRNAYISKQRAPWARGCNPCGEILLPNKGFCNLVEINVAHQWFLDSPALLQRATYLIARANYRQTCVNLRDGILQDAWHTNNENLRLCGVSLCGLARLGKLDPIWLEELRSVAHWGADSMADELGTPHSALVTTIKPGGTLPKIMDTTEGFSMPLGRYIFNWVNFESYDPLLSLLKLAGYEVIPHPSNGMENKFLACLPQDFGFEPHIETAVEQLDRYAILMQSWCDHNVSCTIYYEPHEIESIKQWFAEPANWRSYVGCSFLPRTPTETYDYFPQVAVTREQYELYTSKLRPIDFNGFGSLNRTTEVECGGGACPVQ